MASKLGIHILGNPRDRDWVLSWICRVKPAVVLGMEGVMDDIGLWQRIQRESPATILIGRKFVENQGTYDAGGLAASIIDLVTRAYPNHPVRIWQGYNEDDPKDLATAQMRAAFDMEMANLLAAKGIGYAPYMCYQILMGWDGTKLTGHFLDDPQVRQALSHPNAKYILFHEYSHYPMDRFLDADFAPGTEMGNKVWLLGPWGSATWWMRYRVWHWYLRQSIPGWNKPILNTETGIETYGPTGPPWGGDKQGGAWSYTNAEEFARELLRMDTEVWMKDTILQSLSSSSSSLILATSNMLKGCCIYTHGTGGDPRWDSYDTSGDAGHTLLNIVGQHIIDCGDEGGTDNVPLPELDGIMDITGELPKHPTARYKTRDLSIIKNLVVHHVGAAAQYASARDLAIATASYHVGLGWPGIGYHFCIGRGGDIVQTNSLATSSYHCQGENNMVSVGILLEGLFNGTKPMPAQITALEKLLRLLQTKVGGAVKGHYEIVPTACPGETWFAIWRSGWMNEGTELIRLRLENAALKIETGVLKGRIGRAKEALG